MEQYGGPEQFRPALDEGLLKDIMSYSGGLMESLGLERAPIAPVVIAGPCIIEDEATLEKAAQNVVALGIPVLRGGSYKNRTRYDAFDGLGVPGLKMHVEVCKRYGLKSVSEIMDSSQIDQFRDIDIIQIGEKNMRNYFLLREVASMGKPVILKRNVNANIADILYTIQKLMHYGQKRMVLCERGINSATHETVYRNVLDLNAVAWFKHVLRLPVPVLVDPSHSAGIASLVPVLAKAAMAVGCDGLMIEAHPDPDNARCDREQAITFGGLAEIQRMSDL